MKRWQSLAVLLSLFSFSTLAATPLITMPYRLNVTSLQSNLTGLGSGDPTRSIQQAAAALQWGGGSSLRFKSLGSTSGTTCADAITAGATLIIANSGAGAYSAPFALSTYCAAHIYLITIYNGGASHWASLALSPTQTEVAGVVLGGFIRIAGGSANEVASCLSVLPPPSNADLIGSRNQFCNSEIKGMIKGTDTDDGITSVNDAGTYRATVSAVLSTSLNPTLSSTWSGVTIPHPVAGLGGFDGMLGFKLSKGFQVGEGGVAYAVWDGGSSAPAVLFVAAGPDTGATSTEVLTGIQSWRRPTFAFDSSRNIWWLFAHDSAYEDRVNMYSSSNLSTWTSHGALQKTIYEPYNNGTLATVPISTRMPVGAAYSSFGDRLVISYVQYLGYIHDGGYDSNSADRTVEPIDSYAEWPKAGTLNWVFVNPALPTGIQFQFGTNMNNTYQRAPDGGVDFTDAGFMAFKYSAYASTPPAVVCSTMSCSLDSGFTGSSNPFASDCLAMYTALEPVVPDSRDLGSAFTSYYATDILSDGGLLEGVEGVAARPGMAFTQCVPGGAFCVEGYPPQVPSGSSDWPLSASFNGHADSGYATGVMEFASLNPFDSNIYLNSISNNRAVATGQTMCALSGSSDPDGGELLGNGANSPSFSGWSSQGSTSTVVTPIIRWRDALGATPGEWVMYLGN